MNENKSNANQLTPLVSGDSLLVKYSIVIDTTSGKRIVDTNGNLTLPMALHPNIRFEAPKRLKEHLEHCVLTPTAIFLSVFIQGLHDRDKSEKEARVAPAQRIEKSPPAAGGFVLAPLPAIMAPPRSAVTELVPA